MTEHILLAGRELLLAAQGALKFCREYVDHHQNNGRHHPRLAEYFNKALKTTEDLSRGLVPATAFKKAVEKRTSQLADVIEQEMQRINPMPPSPKTTKHPRPRQTRPTSKRTHAS